MSSITRSYKLHRWETKASHWSLKNGTFTAFILWTRSQCEYTYKLRVFKKSFSSAQQLFWNFITYEAASARNILSIFPCSSTYCVCIILSKSWLPTSMQASHILKIFLVTQQSPHLVAVISVQKLHFSCRKCLVLYFLFFSVWNNSTQLSEAFFFFFKNMGPINLHVSLHTTLWLQGRVKELNLC